MSSYLVDPETFPARAEAKPWGENVFELRVAGRDFRLDGLSIGQRETLERLWGRFGAPAGNEATNVSLFRVPPTRFRPVDPRGWSYALDFDYGPTHTHVTGIDLVGRIDWSRRLEGVLWVTTEETGLFHGAIENFLRVLLAHAVLLEGGVLLHSAGVVDRAGARLFFGHSGAGKSTVAGLAIASGRRVVSDDLNVVLPVPVPVPVPGGGECGFALAGSPFHGDFGHRREDRSPLLGLFRLEQGERDEVRAMGEAEAVASLVACAPFVNHSPSLGDLLWSNLTTLARSVPANVLTFRREGTFWEMLDR